MKRIAYSSKLGVEVFAVNPAKATSQALFGCDETALKQLYFRVLPYAKSPKRRGVSYETRAEMDC